MEVKTVGEWKFRSWNTWKHLHGNFQLFSRVVQIDNDPGSKVKSVDPISRNDIHALLEGVGV